jgi:hypothetical protein
MGGTEGLLSVLTALYLIECVQVIPERAVLLPMKRGPVPSDMFERARPGFAGRRFVLGNLLPPLYGWFVLTPWTFAVSPGGIASERVKTFEGPAAPATSSEPGFRDVGSRGCHVTLGGVKIWTGVCERSAEELAAWLRGLADLSPDERSGQIQTMLRQQMDLELFRERLERARSLARPLLWLCHSVLAGLFIVLPILFLTGYIVVAWPVFVLAMLTLISTSLVILRRMHRRVHGAEAVVPRPPLLDLALVPPGAARAYDVLMRHVLTGLDPVAAARLTVDDASFRQLARKRAWDLGLCDDASPPIEFHPVSTWFRREQGQAMRRFLEREGYSLHRLFLPPVPEGTQESAYCPRCHSLFVRNEGACTDCPDIGLRSLNRCGSL